MHPSQRSYIESQARHSSPEGTNLAPPKDCESQSKNRVGPVARWHGGPRRCPRTRGNDRLSGISRPTVLPEALLGVRDRGWGKSPVTWYKNLFVDEFNMLDYDMGRITRESRILDSELGSTR